MSSFEQRLRAPDRLRAFLEEDYSQFADVVLKVGKDGTEVPTSRLLLCAHSAFFQDFFSSTALKSHGSGTRTVVPLEELDGPTVRELMAALLTAIFQVTADRLEAFCKAVDFLQLQTFKDTTLEAVKHLSLQKAREGKAAHGQFLTELAELGDCYHFDAFLKYASHVASHDPELVQEHLASWPASGLEKMWVRFRELDNITRSPSAALGDVRCRAHTVYGACLGAVVCEKCRASHPPALSVARCAAVGSPPSKCLCTL